MVLVVTNENASGYSNLLCHIYADTHWTYDVFTIDHLSLLNLPDGITLTNFTEVRFDRVGLFGLTLELVALTLLRCSDELMKLTLVALLTV